jgi:hypothetical protein
MQKSPIPQGFLHLSKVRISICIVLFNANFIEMQSTNRESQTLLRPQRRMILDGSSYSCLTSRPRDRAFS